MPGRKYAATQIWVFFAGFLSASILITGLFLLYNAPVHAPERIPPSRGAAIASSVPIGPVASAIRVAHVNVTPVVVPMPQHHVHEGECAYFDYCRFLHLFKC